ncbi:putative uracil-DNA glycosylase isoform X2 [Apostichopus japonicus]|uniref:Putative uracil-DNA glycosylase isoform X2 n=1 Tax=Stichopus japonicus TaxID=307972 RepID=A0A2G8JIA9_STIJA|nr:putative uracil-DNA glycosylase isoform X2 [Apostichopus japonicus]
MEWCNLSTATVGDHALSNFLAYLHEATDDLTSFNTENVTNHHQCFATRVISIIFKLAELLSFLQLQHFLSVERKSYNIFPPPHQVYAWTQMCDIRDVKVVILGQNPYHNVGQANGLSFSVPQGIPLPRSLQNIYTELAKDITGFVPPGHGDLTGWAKQGVLLLNTVLTVRQATKPKKTSNNFHKRKGWEKFTDAVISWLNNNQKNIVFMLWGSDAQKKKAMINTVSRRIVVS